MSAQSGHSESPECTCDPAVWVHDHREETLFAWQWPDGPMMLQPVGGVAVQVTSQQFEETVRDTWTRRDRRPRPSDGHAHRHRHRHDDCAGRAMTLLAHIAALAAVLARATADALDQFARSVITQQERCPEVLPDWCDDGSAQW